jgi:hypothetical protein
VCNTRLHKKLFRVLFGFRLALGARSSVGAPVFVVWHRLFNRHLNVPREQSFISFMSLWRLWLPALQTILISSYSTFITVSGGDSGVLVTSSLEESQVFWIKFGGEEGVVCQCGFLVMKDTEIKVEETEGTVGSHTRRIYQLHLNIKYINLTGLVIRRMRYTQIHQSHRLSHRVGSVCWVTHNTLPNMLVGKL